MPNIPRKAMVTAPGTPPALAFWPVNVPCPPVSPPMIGGVDANGVFSGILSVLPQGAQALVLSEGFEGGMHPVSSIGLTENLGALPTGNPGDILAQTVGAVRLRATGGVTGGAARWNAVAFGADPTGATLSHGAIQAAINAAHAAGGGTVWLDEGPNGNATYLIGAQLLHHPNVWLRGAQRGTVTIKAANGLNNTIIVNPALLAGSGTDTDIILSDLTIDLNGTHQTANTSPQYSRTSDLLVERVHVVNPYGFGLLINGVAGPQVNTRPVVRDVVIDGTGQITNNDMLDFGALTDGVMDRVVTTGGTATGISTAFAIGLSMTNCTASGAGGVGISVEASINVNMVACIAHGCQLGFNITPWETISPQQSAQNVTMTACQAYNNTTYGIQANSITIQSQTAGIQGFVVVGCLVYANRQGGILLQSTQGYAIVGNMLWNNSFGNPGAFPAIRLFPRPDLAHSNSTSRGTIALNKVFDTQGTPSQTVGLQIIDFDTLEILNNSFDQMSSVANTILVNADAGNGSYVARGNRGYNPLVNVATPTFPLTTVWVQNTTGVDVTAALFPSGATQTHLYVNTTNSTVGALDYSSSTPGSLTIAANAWVRVDYSAGSYAWKWQGN